MQRLVEDDCSRWISECAEDRDISRDYEKKSLKGLYHLITHLYLDGEFRLKCAIVVEKLGTPEIQARIITNLNPSERIAAVLPHGTHWKSSARSTRCAKKAPHGLGGSFKGYAMSASLDGQ